MDAHRTPYSSRRNQTFSRIYQDLGCARLCRKTGPSQNSVMSSLKHCTQSIREHRTSKPHVAVIGAGLSGLRCADVLLQQGFRVTVIEARDRVGGRICQEKLPNGHWVDIGPNWIHGTSDNPILDLAKQTGTVTSDPESTAHVFDKFGDLMPLEEGEKYSTLMWEIIEKAFKYSNKFGSDICEGQSLYDFFQDKVIRLVPETEPEYESKRELLLQMSEMWGAFVGSRVTQQSLKFFWLEECIEGENLFCAGTYRNILAAIAEPALAGAEMRFKTKVNRISYKLNPEDQIDVHVDGHHTLSFDEVVVTTPLGWLKTHLDAFSPPLPARLTKAIKSIGYGCLEKVYISFPTAFWLSNENGRKTEGSLQWVSPNYAPDSNPERWGQEVVELASLPPGLSHPTLLFYIYGEQSRHITSKVAELQDEGRKEEFLADFFRPYYSRLPNYSESLEECIPTNFVSTDWLHDELAGCGSYSNFQVGLEDGDGDILVMREGLPDQGLWFAGEHTAPFLGLGTATGAYWSGEAVGKRLAEAYGQPVETE